MPYIVKQGDRVDNRYAEIYLDTEDELVVKDLIQKHYEYTNSKKSKMILDNWDQEKSNIVRVIPKMYKKIMSEYKAV